MTNDTSQAPVASTINSYIDAVSFSDAVRNLVVWSSAHKADEPRPWVYVSRKHGGVPYAMTINSARQFEIAIKNANDGWKTVLFTQMPPLDAIAPCYMVDQKTALALLNGEMVLL